MQMAVVLESSGTKLEQRKTQISLSTMKMRTKTSQSKSRTP